MSVVSNSRLRFRFDARVEYVTEELSHNNTVYFMFNIKVVAEPEGSETITEPIQWSVIKSEDDFLQTHKVLKSKYGLLKNFQFRNPSTIGNNMFHLTNPVKPRRERKDEFLLAILSLDPTPDEVSSFLCLDNAMYFTKETKEDHSGSSSAPNHTNAQLHTRAEASMMNSHVSNTASLPVATAVGVQKARAKWYLDAGLLVSFLVLAVGAALISQLASTVGAATGLNHKDSIGERMTCAMLLTALCLLPPLIKINSLRSNYQYFGITMLSTIHLTLHCSITTSLVFFTVMLLYTAFAQFIHTQMMILKARLEVVVLLGIVFTYGHRVIGYALGKLL